jgi:hypothetical protein
MPQRASRRTTPEPNKLSRPNDDAKPSAQDTGSSWRASLRRYLWLDDFRPTSASQAGRSAWSNPRSRRRAPVAGARFLLATVAAGVTIALIILYSRAA